MEFDELIDGFAAKYGIEGLAAKDGTAVLRFDDVSAAFICDESGASVTVAAEIGEPPPCGDSGRFGNLLLQANHLFRGTGGATLSRDPESGAYCIARRLPLASLSLDEFSAHVAKIVSQAETWRDAMETFRQAEDAADDGAEESPSPFDALRV